MTNSLGNLIWISEKRKNVLLLLNDGPKSMEHILKALNQSLYSLSPQMKILLNNSLIREKETDVYELTEVGNIIVRNMYPLFNTLVVLEEDLDYWNERNLKHVPDSILERIGELGNYMIMEPDQTYHYDVPEEFEINLKKSKRAKILLSYYHPIYIRIIEEVFQSTNSCDLIFLESVFTRILDEKLDFINLCFEDNKKKLFVYKADEEGTIPSIFVADTFSYYFFFNKNHIFDNRQIMSFDSSSILWGSDLFEYYKSNSIQIKSKNDFDKYRNGKTEKT